MSIEAPPLSEHRISLRKRILIALAVLVVASVVTIWVARSRTSSTGRGGLAEVIAETDALDPRWRWEAIDEDRPSMPPFGNSILRSNEVVRMKGPWQQKELVTAAGKDVLEDRILNYRLDSERLGIVRNYLTKRQTALELALTLKDMPRGRATIALTPDVIGTLLPHVQNSREVVALLQLESEMLMHDGRSTGIADRVRAMLHSQAGIRDEPFLISQLVRLACRALAARQVERTLGLGELRDEDCRKLGEHFAAERAENLLLAGVRGERAGFHILFENLESGRVSLAEGYRALEGRYGEVPDVLVHAGAMLYSPRLYEDHANFLRWVNRACAIAALPPHEQAAEWSSFEKKFKGFVGESRQSLRNLVTILLMPAIAKVAESTLRDQATLGCVQSALAAERFRLANGRWPKTLEELRPKFLREVPMDPHSGKALLLAATEDGIVIYSVGMDGKDDGGQKLDVRGKVGTDLGVRLWNVGRRGLEALKMPEVE